ncbi:hypothetical protein Alg215_12151, partial [Pyrenophora tritici-repentis]
MDHDPKIPAPNVILHAHKDWHLWFPLLEKHSRDRGVWEYIDPDVVSDSRVTRRWQQPISVERV